MKFLVIGCGSIGERHIRNLRLLTDQPIIACDTNSERLRLIKEKYHLETYLDVDEALNQKPDAVLICTPPTLHISQGLKAVEHDAHLFMEKPLSHSLKHVDLLLKQAKKKNVIIFVGYNLRFHPGIKLLKKLLDEGTIGKVFSARVEFGQYLPDWRPQQNYRQTYTARKELGGGIILDASHEIDYIRYLLGEVTTVSCISATLSDLEVNVEDTAEILTTFKNNGIAEIHLDFVQREYSRNCKIIGEKGTIVWDYPGNYVKTYNSETKQWTTHPTVIEPNEMYLAEMKHFLACLQGNATPLVNGDDAKKTLEIVLAAKQSSNTGKMIRL